MKKIIKHIGNIVVGILIFSLPTGVSGQNKMMTVSGTVSDENGNPLVGASVLIETTTVGQITDADGKYRIQVPEGGALVFSFMGYKSQTIAVHNRKTIDVVLIEDVNLLDEVVVIGYGTMRRSDLTGSVSSVNAKALENHKTASVFEALGGMVAGVNITSTDGTPGSSFDVRIRGIGTITGDASPLYIIDGFEVSSLDHLANQDIQSIEILKDASASAIYGSRAANGVVLITTKSGHNGRPEISYNGSVSYRILSRHLDLLTPYEFVDLQMELNPLKYEGLYYRIGNDVIGTPYRYQTMEDYKNVSGIDWQEEAFRPTWSQNHDISVRGGNKETQYALSYSNFDEEGLFETSSYAKNTAQLKLTQKIYKQLTFSSTISYANLKRTGIGTGGSTLSNILMYRPVGGLFTTDYDLRYNPVDPIMDQLGTNSQVFYNPLVNAENTDQKQVIDTWNAYGALTWQIGKYLSFRTAGSYYINTGRNDRFYKNGSSTADRGSGPYGYSRTSRNMRYSNTNQLTFNRTFNKKHKVNVILGHETSYTRAEWLYGEAHDFPLDNLGVDNLGLGAVPSTVNSNKTDNRRLSFFSRAFYSFDNRYMVTATIRADASSVFAKNNKWGYFPSFAAAWNLSNESFLKDKDWLSNLKLRVGWGLVGNDRITNYLSLDLYTASMYGVGSEQVIALLPSHLANKDLKWEASQTTNIGLDLGFLNSRLNITIDAFIKDSKDLLLSHDLSYVTGFASQWQNIGDIRNKGIELTINSVNISTKNFTWTTDFNISFIRNTLISLRSDKSYMFARSGINTSFSNYDYIAEEGKPLGNMYGYVFDGVYQSSDFNVYGDGSMHLKPGVTDISSLAGTSISPGFVKDKDLDGDGIITTNDRTCIGNGQPDWYGGLSNTFRFYGVDLSFMLQFVYGNDIYNAQRMYATQSDLEMINMLGEVANRWTTDNASNKVPSAKGYVRNDIYSRFIEDGSFLRLKNLTLGYTFPEKWVRKARITKLRLYATAQNLFCLTGYSGYDPEVSMSSSPLMPGLDYGAYPKSRIWTVGVELNF